MENHTALLRGVNVGGKNKLPMAELRSTLSNAGLQQVQTYIQSGNVVFQSPKDGVALAALIAEQLHTHFAIDTPVMVRTQTELQDVRDANPFSAHENLDKALQLVFLSSTASDADLDKLRALKSDSESFELSDACFYLYAPDGIGRSKLAAGAEKHLKVATTTRNWRTVNKILDMML